MDSQLTVRIPRTLKLAGLVNVPAVVLATGEDGTRRFFEFFTANIRNPNTRAAYYRAVATRLAYHIATPVSLASRSDQQMVRIVQTSLPSTFHHIATPVLTSYVYREAEVTNNSEEDLLGGPITVYLNGSFVGRSEMPTVARGQTFVVG